MWVEGKDPGMESRSVESIRSREGRQVGDIPPFAKLLQTYTCYQATTREAKYSLQNTHGRRLCRAAEAR